MDERRTLQLLGWTIGTVVSCSLILEAIALSASPTPGNAAPAANSEIVNVGPSPPPR